MFETATTPPVSNLETAMNSALSMAPLVIGGLLALVLLVYGGMLIAEKQRDAKFLYAVETVRRAWPNLSHEKQAEKVMELMSLTKDKKPKNR